MENRRWFMTCCGSGLGGWLLGVGSGLWSARDDSPNILTLVGKTCDTTPMYKFTVNGDVEKSTANGASIDMEDTVVKTGNGNTRVFGHIQNFVDSYEIEGTIVEFYADPQVDASLNGEELRVE